jgi:hypothetical protein
MVSYSLERLFGTRKNYWQRVSDRDPNIPVHVGRQALNCFDIGMRTLGEQPKASSSYLPS